MRREKELVGVLVGLILGLSIGSATAVPAEPDRILIVEWPRNLNVTIANPAPIDTDGDGVPDSMDAFPADPFLSWRETADVNLTEQGGVNPDTVTISCRTFNELPSCNLHAGALFLVIFWETGPIFAGSGSANIAVNHVYNYPGAFTCSPERTTFSTGVTRTVRSASHTYRFAVVSGPGGIVPFWDCFTGVDVTLSTTSSWSSYLHLNLEFQG